MGCAARTRRNSNPSRASTSISQCVILSTFVDVRVAMSPQSLSTNDSTESRWSALLPCAFILALLSLSVLPAVQAVPELLWSVWLVCIALIGWYVALLFLGRKIHVEININRVHYIQASVQLCVYAYWGYYWHEVYDHALLILAQIIFAYGFDNLLSWSRRGTWRLGFGPFPIILSTNLFLWFRDDWFFLQFLLVATIFLGKEFLRWNRDGQSTHIFNPSAFALALFSLTLIVTQNTGITWGEAIATTLILPEYIYEEIFLLGLLVMFFFSITEITVAAVLMLSALNVIYTLTTGLYFFDDSNIPIAVFLGLHLLVTDPATTPRGSAGKFVFGLLYGAGVFIFYGALEFAGAPTFYDKLLCVPLLNLSVRLLDRLPMLQHRHAVSVMPARRSNQILILLWIPLFIGLMATDFLGKGHQGRTVAFWKTQCHEHRQEACAALNLLPMAYCKSGFSAECARICREGSDAACHFLAQAPEDELKDVVVDSRLMDHALSRACLLGNAQGCRRISQTVDPSEALSLSCEAGFPDDCRILGEVYMTGWVVGKDGHRAVSYATKACTMGDADGCATAGQIHLMGIGMPRSPSTAAAELARSCALGNATSCSDVGLMHYRGDGIPKDQEKGIAYLGEACDKGLANGCRWRAELGLAGKLPNRTPQKTAQEAQEKPPKKTPTTDSPSGFSN